MVPEPGPAIKATYIFAFPLVAEAIMAPPSPQGLVTLTLTLTFKQQNLVACFCLHDKRRVIVL